MLLICSHTMVLTMLVRSWDLDFGDWSGCSDVAFPWVVQCPCH